ncbi:hypothetical protein OSCI_3960021 [Kamptonema sp. PCC 6506]|nr:hypothetical protein OSCI_3960021 [Kamptonema sp. PCC 6506]
MRILISDRAAQKHENTQRLALSADSILFIVIIISEVFLT